MTESSVRESNIGSSFSPISVLECWCYFLGCRLLPITNGFPFEVYSYISSVDSTPLERNLHLFFVGMRLSEAWTGEPYEPALDNENLFRYDFCDSTHQSLLSFLQSYLVIKFDTKFPVYLPVNITLPVCLPLTCFSAWKTSHTCILYPASNCHASLFTFVRPPFSEETLAWDSPIHGPCCLLELCLTIVLRIVVGGGSRESSSVGLPSARYSSFILPLIKLRFSVFPACRLIAKSCLLSFFFSKDIM